MSISMRCFLKLYDLLEYDPFYISVDMFLTFRRYFLPTSSGWKNILDVHNH